MKIVVLDGYAANPNDISWDEMAALGELTVYDRTPPEEIAQRIGDAEAVFTNKAPITRETMEACPNLKFISVLATGFNIVDTAAAKEKGIVVCNVPAYSTTSVTQHVFAMILAACNHISEHSQSVKQGDWQNCKDFVYWNYPLIEIAGKTLGIIGMGQIGQSVAKVAKAFGMKVLAYSRTVKPELEDENLRFVSLEELLASSDIISIHCPLTPDTQGLICKETLKQMKDGVILINTSRGPTIVEQDLYDALESGKVAYAGVDVLEKEPPRAGSLLIDHPNCFVTPHIGWAPFEARIRLMNISVANLKAFQNGQPQNVVNK